MSRTGKEHLASTSPGVPESSNCRGFTQPSVVPTKDFHYNQTCSLSEPADNFHHSEVVYLCSVRVCLLLVTGWNGTGQFRPWASSSCLVVFGTGTNSCSRTEYTVNMPNTRVPPNRRNHAERPLARLFHLLPPTLPPWIRAAGRSSPSIHAAGRSSPSSAPSSAPLLRLILNRLQVGGCVWLTAVKTGASVQRSAGSSGAADAPLTAGKMAGNGPAGCAAHGRDDGRRHLVLNWQPERRATTADKGGIGGHMAAAGKRGADIQGSGCSWRGGRRRLAWVAVLAFCNCSCLFVHACSCLLRLMTSFVVYLYMLCSCLLQLYKFVHV